MVESNKIKELEEQLEKEKEKYFQLEEETDLCMK